MKHEKTLWPAAKAAEESPQVLTVRHAIGYERIYRPLQVIARLLIVFLASLGVNRLLADSLGTTVGWLTQVWPLLFWLTVFSLLFRSKKGFIGGLALMAAGLGGLWLVTDQNPIRYFASGVALIWNRFMTVIDGMGYLSLSPIGEGLSLTEESLFFTLSLLSTLVFFLSLRKKVRLIPALTYVVLIGAPILIYHMPEKNDGMALLAAALTGMVAMRLSEKHTDDQFSSGFTGATAALLALLLLLTPILTVKEPWDDMPGVTSWIEELRVMITDLAAGKTPSLPFEDDFEAHNTPRSAVATPRSFRGRQILTAYADTDVPLYLREWVGGAYRDNSWYMPDTDGVEPPYVPDPRKADPDHVIENFLTIYQDMTGKDGTSPMGLYRGNVAVEPAAVGGLMPLPVTAVSDPLAPAGSGSANPSYRIYSDGIYASNRLARKLPYEMSVIQPLRYTTETYEQYVEAFYRYVLYTQDGVMPDYNTLARRMAMHFGWDKLTDIVNVSLSRDRYVETLYGEPIQNEAIDRLVEELFRTTEVAAYYNLVSYEGEEETPSGNGVITLSGENGERLTYYLSSLGEVIYADEVARLVADYLESRCTYTLEPKATAEDAMEAFLFRDREGYCVQFATAATLILRRLGFSARYAEGYIARDFSENRDDDFVQAYAAQVKDDDAHAWMEIWVSGFGWKPVEVTPGYTEVFYRPDETTSEEPDDTPETTEPIPDTEDTSVSEEPSSDSTHGEDKNPVETTPDTEDPADIETPTDVRLWLPVLAAATVALLTFLFIRRGRRRRMAKEERIRLAQRGCLAQQRQALASLLAEDLNGAFRAYGLMPQTGELPSAFGQRADAALAALSLQPPASRGVAALAHLVYGGFAEEADLLALAAVTDALMRQAKRRLGFFRFFYYRWMIGIV